MKTRIALMGAGGKMGCRISKNMLREMEYEMLNVEVSQQGVDHLKDLGLTTTPAEVALAVADVVILAIPDKLIGKLSPAVVQSMKPGAILMSLDPAAAYAEVIPLRDDLSYFVTHPCHPILFDTESNAATCNDWFGGDLARQSIVCALHRGPEAHYAVGEAIACKMFQPILRSHRITVEQMAILEPAVVETTTASLIYACKEAMEEGIRMGVPREVAWDFVMGHIRTELAIIFDYAGFPFSDGAIEAIKQAQSRIFLPDWKEQIFNLPAIRRSVEQITDKAGISTKSAME